MGFFGGRDMGFTPLEQVHGDEIDGVTCNNCNHLFEIQTFFENVVPFSSEPGCIDVECPSCKSRIKVNVFDGAISNEDKPEEKFSISGLKIEKFGGELRLLIKRRGNLIFNKKIRLLREGEEEPSVEKFAEPVVVKKSLTTRENHNNRTSYKTDFDSNPYKSPEHEFLYEDSSENYCQLKLFSPFGRLGRMRWVYYNFFAVLIFVVSNVIFSLVLVSLFSGGRESKAQFMTSSSIITLIVLLMLLVFLTFQGAKRFRDIGVTGWFSLFILIISIVEMYLLSQKNFKFLIAFVIMDLLLHLFFAIVPGSYGRNRYGSEAPPNDTKDIVLFTIAITTITLFALLLILGAIVAAIGHAGVARGMVRW